MADKRGQIPPGPPEAYQTADDLLDWMGKQFRNFGDIYKASLYGTDVYVIRDLDFANHVLVENSQNYVKGQFIKRVALLLGNGLMVSEGELWKRQRRMIQPVFQSKSMGALTKEKMIAAVIPNYLKRWQLAAQKNESINVTRDVSGMALRWSYVLSWAKITNKSDFISISSLKNRRAPWRLLKLPQFREGHSTGR